ncbi:O-methyltransferase [Tsukamurella soli]|uniref:Class I SAM-dependent methyltransferase n=1 Tax=Tsukamurella soli TaxID=644556 RepID=A0ABP8JHN5_9ACTN
MTSTLTVGPVADAIARLYHDAQRQSAAAPRADAEVRRRRRAEESAMSAQERADASAERYMPVSPDTGRLLYALVRAARPAVVVEFGTSYGISTLHLAAAVRDNGIGHIYTSELSVTKIAAARATFVEAGVADLVTVLAGDACETLAGVSGPVGLVLLDGWKDLYVPVLQVLQDKLAPGATVVADNASKADARPYLDHVRDGANGYVSVNFPAKHDDSIEISCRV